MPAVCHCLLVEQVCQVLDVAGARGVVPMLSTGLLVVAGDNGRGGRLLARTRCLDGGVRAG